MTELKPVQVAGKAASKGRKGFGYFMEMGLGKTLTALSEFSDGIPDGITRHIVVCPNSFKSGWRAEIEKHNFDFDYHIYESGAYNSAWFQKKFDRPPLVIVNYEAIRRQETQGELRVFMSQKPTYLTIDESIQLKNNKAAQTKAVIDLSKYAAQRRVLSGKPTTQGPHDLWGQMKAIGQLEGKNYYAFRSMFCRMGGYMNRQVIGTQNEEFLIPLIEPHVFRANKKDWGFDVPKVYTTRDYEMGHTQARQYKAMEQDFVLWLNDEQNVNVDAAITKYIKLAQIQAGFIIDENERIHDLVDWGMNPRVNAIKEIMNDELEGKLIVVYIHRHSYDILSKSLANYNPAYIKGLMTPAELDQQKDKFNKDNSCRVILVQEKAGKYGHTLLGGPEPHNRCSTAAFFENSYSLDDRSQVEDRCHRFGQTADSVLYIDLCGTPLDRRVTTALQRKESIFQAIFSLIKAAVPA